MASQKTAVAFVIPGGGTRTRIPQQFFKMFLNQWGVPQSQFGSRTDLFAGTSSGAFQALAYSYNMTPDSLDPFILNTSTRIFTTRALPVGCDAANDSYRPSFLAKIGLLAISDPFYKSVCPPEAGDSNWGSNILKSSLEGLFGTDTLQDLNNKVIIPSYENDTNTPVLFSNILGFPYMGATEKISDVAMCSSAAPVYLPSYPMNGHIYIDGGVTLNNACQEAYTALLALHPLAEKYVVISVGTGREPNVIEGTPSTPEETSLQALYNLSSKCISGAAALAVNDMIYQSNATLSQLYYYHFDLDFPVGFDSEFDQSTPAWFSSLDALTTARFNEDNAAISSIISHLDA